MAAARFTSSGLPSPVRNFKDAKGSDNLVGGVDDDDDDGVLNGIGELVVKGGIGRVVSETDTGGKEDLADGILPDLAAGELVAVPRAEVELDALSCVGESGGATDENEN